MQSREKNNLIIIRLFKGEDLFSSLKKIAQKHKIKTAVVLQGIGQLKNFKLGYFKKKGNYMPQEFKKPYELVSLTGTIIKSQKDYDFHLHAVLSDEKKKTCAGHLFNGEVSVTNEIIILKTEIRAKRKLEKETGLKGLYL
jgi:predicted DNA-binding protein with PD1-like motif